MTKKNEPIVCPICGRNEGRFIQNKYYGSMTCKRCYNNHRKGLPSPNQKTSKQKLSDLEKTLLPVLNSIESIEQIWIAKIPMRGLRKVSFLINEKDNRTQPY